MDHVDRQKMIEDQLALMNFIDLVLLIECGLSEGVCFKTF